MESEAGMSTDDSNDKSSDKKTVFDIKEEEYKRAYSQALQEGKEKNYRIPIMLIGQGRSGKTSLMRRLLGLPYDKDQPSTVGIDVHVIELTEQNAEDPWKKREMKKFMTSESEAKTVLYKKIAEYLDRGVPRNLEGDAPVPVMPLSTEEISEIESQRSTEHDQKEVFRLFVSDFAGQSIYYDTHGCFVKPHCPYVLVHDLSLEFDKPAVLRFKASYEEEEIEMYNPHRNTNLDNFTSWLKFLQGLGKYQDQQFPDKPCHCTTADGDKFKRPPVLIALTHNDKVKDNGRKLNRVRNRISSVLSGGNYENVISDVFLIDNTLEGDDGDDVRDLRRKLFDLSNGILNQEILMPVKWLDFEAALSRKLSPDCKYIPVDEAKQEAEACGVGEFNQAIKFLHRQGVVVHHSGSSKVVLDPPWLMNHFTKVISMPGKLDALSRHALDVFKQKGILFQEYLETLEDAELLEELMQKFNLICPCQHDGKAAFYVPSVAPIMIPGKELEACKKELNVPSLFVTFPRQLVPMSLFTKLRVKLISEWKKRFPNQQATPSFYCNYSLLPLIIDGDVYDVYSIHLHEFIKFAVFPKQDGDHFKFASHFVATLKKCLDDLRSPDQLLFSMSSYDLEVKCTCCFGKEERKCSRHRETQCHSDRCGHRHFWKLSDLQRFYNDQSRAVCRSDKRSSKVFDIKSVKIWLNTAPDAAMIEDCSTFGSPNETSIEASSSGPESTENSNLKGHMPANKARRIAKCLESVGMIALKNKDDDELFYTATGWLVAKEESEFYIMTNYHVISTIDEYKRQTQRELKVVFQFDYRTTAQSSCVEFELAQKDPVPSDAVLDYAVLKFQGNCPADRERLDVCTRSPNPNSNVTVIGHPETKPMTCMSGKVLYTPRPSTSVEVRKWVEDKIKQYCPHKHSKEKEREVVCAHNYKWGKFNRRKDFLLIHNCQTGHGASGSPVVNDKGLVIALHSWGMFLGNEQQREKPALEFAHSINSIVQDIKKKNEEMARKLNFDKLDT